MAMCHVNESAVARFNRLADLPLQPVTPSRQGVGGFFRTAGDIWKIVPSARRESAAHPLRQASWLFHIERADPMAMCMSRYW
jgi:hypothetical protein